MKRLISLLFALLMMFSAFSILTVSGGAATLDDSKIYVMVSGNYYEVHKGDVLTYIYEMKYMDEKISSIDAYVDYDSNGLKHIPVYDEYGDYDLDEMCPVMGYQAVCNFNIDGQIITTFSYMNGIRFMADDSKLFSLQFEVITDTPGVYEIDGTLKNLADINMTKIVYNEEKLLDYTETEYIAEFSDDESESETSTESETAAVTDIVESSEESTTVEPTQDLTSNDDLTEKSGIYVKVGDKYYEVQKGDVVIYDMTLTYTNAKISSMDVRVNYDLAGLRFAPEVDEYGDVDAGVMFPITGYATVYNFNKEGEILFNYSSISGARFMKENSKVFVGEFEVITDTPGIYEIDGHFQTLADIDLNKIVFDGEILQEFESQKSLQDLIPVEIETAEPSEDITTVQPTKDTSDETEPATIPPSEGWTGSGPSEPYESDDDSTEEPTDPIESEEATDPAEETTADVESTEETVANEDLYIKADGVYYKAEKGQTFTYQYCISVDSSRKIGTMDVLTTYDSQGLDFVPAVDEYGDIDTATIFPKISGMVYNFNIDGEIRYNYSNIGGVRLADNSVVFSGQFTVTADSGVYSINTTMKSLGDTDNAVIVFGCEKYDEFEENGNCPELEVAEMTDEPTQESADNRVTVYLINSAQWGMGIYAHAYTQSDGDSSVEDVYMRKVAMSAPNGADVYKAYIDGDCESIYFSYYRNKTETTQIRADQFYDNVTNQWYEKLSDRPEIDPTEAESETSSTEPTEPITEPITEAPTKDPTIDDVIEPGEGNLDGDASVIPTEPSTDDMTEGDEGLIEPPFVEEPSTEEPTLESSEEESSQEPTEDESSEEESSEEPTEDESSEEEPTQDPISPMLLLGDIDGNGKVEVLDATLIQRHEARFERLTDEQLMLADTNKDGEVNVLDATMIQRLVAKFITNF